jgi:hypothetical protein
MHPTGSQRFAVRATLSTLVREWVTFDCVEQSGLNRLAEGAYSVNGDNRPMRLRCGVQTH